MRCIKSARFSVSSLKKAVREVYKAEIRELAVSPFPGLTEN